MPMGGNIPVVLCIENCYFYVLLVFKMQRHVSSKGMHAKQISQAKRGNRNIKIGIIIEELMGFQNVLRIGRKFTSL